MVDAGVVVVEVERAGVESVAEPNDVADVVQARRLVAAALGGRAATRVKNA